MAESQCGLLMDDIVQAIKKRTMDGEITSSDIITALVMMLNDTLMVSKSTIPLPNLIIKYINVAIKNHLDIHDLEEHNTVFHKGHFEELSEQLLELEEKIIVPPEKET